MVRQYNNLKTIAKKMLAEAGVVQDGNFDNKVADMAIYLLGEMYNQGFSEREINEAVRVLRAATFL